MLSYGSRGREQQVDKFGKKQSRVKVSFKSLSDGGKLDFIGDFLGTS